MNRLAAVVVLIVGAGFSRPLSSAQQLPNEPFRQFGTSVTGAFEGWFAAPDGTRYFLIGSALVVVILVVCVLGLITRWVFKPSRPRTGPVVDATESTDLGMLDVLAADLSRADAMSLRAVLGDAGIRSSISRRRNGDVDVLVFRDDLPRARELLR